MAETVVVDPAVLLPQLIAENAELKTRIGLPEHECVLQSVLQEHLQRFFDDARRVLDVAVSQSVGLSGDGDRVEGAGRPSALIESLRALSAQNESLLRELTETHSSRVMNLISQVDALSSERDALLCRVRELEDESAAASSPPALLCELRGLRSSESALRAELDAVAARGAEAVAAAEALARGGADAALSLPPVLERLAALRLELREARLVADALRVELREAKGRAALEHKAALERLADEAAAAQGREAQLTAELRLSREESRQHEAQSARLAAELSALRDEARLAAKRRRLDGGAGEAAAALSADSVRREAVAFWRDGRAELERLQREQSHCRKAREKWRAAQERLQRFERERGAVVGKIALLAEELGRARDEAEELRAQAAGFAVERDFLRASLADLLAGEMREEDVARAAQCIRDAAAAAQQRSANGGASDPQRAQQLEKAQQELRGDVARLERQRDRLQKHIALREERIVALHTQEDILRISSAKDKEHEKDEEMNRKSGEGHSFVAIGHMAYRSGDVFPLPPPSAQALTVEETVSLAQAHANDALVAAAAAATSVDAETSSFSARSMTHTALQGAVLSLNAQLRACRSDLETIAAERDSARAQLHTSESELRKALDANNAALRSALERNASLSRDSAALRAAHTALQSRHQATASLAQRFAAALTAVLALHRAGTGVAAALHSALLEERAATAELQRRAATAATAPDAELQRVVAALERVGDAVAQATAQRAMQRDAAEAQHVGALAAAVQRQDERLRALHIGFANECRTIGEGVAQRIAEAVRAGDGHWRARVAQIAEERNALQAQIAAERDILAGMQHTLSAQRGEMSRQDEEEEEEEEGQRHVEDADESEVLVVIQKLLAAVAMPGEAFPTTETVSHAAGEEHAEEKEGWKRSESATPEVEIEKPNPTYEENEEGDQEIEEEIQGIEEEKQEIEEEKQGIEDENEEDEKSEWNHEEYEGEEESPKM